jgi:predicted metal-dependent hydrolase
MISFLGQRYQIQVQAAADISSTTIVGNILQLRMVGEATVDAIEKQIKAWYRAEASVVFAERLALAYEQVKHLGIPPVQSWNIRKMKTRWGSCRRSGKITLNKTLIKLPLPIIDYVIIHELCHLKEFNHGKGFYQLMSQALPDWYERREALFKYALG